MINFIKKHKIISIVILLFVVILFVLFFVSLPKRKDQSIQNNQNVEAEVEKTPEESQKIIDEIKEILSSEIATLPDFKDFPAIEPGNDGWAKNNKPAPVDFDSSPKLEDYVDKGQITYTATLGPNFADHYTLIELGCGTGCAYYMIVDTKTGKLYDERIGDFAGLGTIFQIESNLVIVTPPEDIYHFCYRDPSVKYYFCNDKLVSSYYVWRGDHFELIGRYKVLYDKKAE